MSFLDKNAQAHQVVWYWVKVSNFFCKVYYYDIWFLFKYLTFLYLCPLPHAIKSMVQKREKYLFCSLESNETFVMQIYDFIKFLYWNINHLNWSEQQSLRSLSSLSVVEHCFGWRVQILACSITSSITFFSSSFCYFIHPPD